MSRVPPLVAWFRDRGSDRSRNARRSIHPLVIIRWVTIWRTRASAQYQQLACSAIARRSVNSVSPPIAYVWEPFGPRLSSNRNPFSERL